VIPSNCGHSLSRVTRKTTVNYRLFAAYFKGLGFPDGN
jgi:hypothetical protein